MVFQSLFCARLQKIQFRRTPPHIVAAQLRPLHPWGDLSVQLLSWRHASQRALQPNDAFIKVHSQVCRVSLPNNNNNNKSPRGHAEDHVQWVGTTAAPARSLLQGRVSLNHHAKSAFMRMQTWMHAGTHLSSRFMTSHIPDARPAHVGRNPDRMTAKTATFGKFLRQMQAAFSIKTWGACWSSRFSVMSNILSTSLELVPSELLRASATSPSSPAMAVIEFSDGSARAGMNVLATEAAQRDKLR